MIIIAKIGLGLFMIFIIFLLLMEENDFDVNEFDLEEQSISQMEHSGLTNKEIKEILKN